MNQKGSVLVSVLLLAGLLILLAVPVLQVANAGYKTSVNEQVRTQAFYLAEAGKEHMAKLAMDKLKEVAATIAAQVPITLQADESLGAGSYSASAAISHHEGNQYRVEVLSTGKVSSLQQVARQTILVTLVPSPGSWALFVHTGLLPEMDKNGHITIDGPMGTSEETGVSYSQVPFPSSLEQKTIIGDKIEAEGHYDEIRLSNAEILTIATGDDKDEVRKVRVPSITLGNSAIIRVSGKGRLLLYVDGNISIGQHGKLTETPDGAIVEIYSAGESIVSAQGNESDPNHLLMQRTLLFAPGATFIADNHVRTDGAIIVGSIRFWNHLHLKRSEAFDEDDNSSSPQIIIEKELWSPRLP